MTPHPSCDPATHSLICAVCNQAIQDYFLLRRAKAIRWGRVMPVKPRKGHMSYVVKDISFIEVVELVEFMQRDMHRLLHMVGMDVNAADVVKSLRRLERSEDWKRMFEGEV